MSKTSFFMCQESEDKFVAAFERVSYALSTPAITPTPETDISVIIYMMLRGERVLYHNRVRVAEYARQQLNMTKPPTQRWASEVEEVLRLLNPNAPKGSHIIDMLNKLLNELDSAG